MRQQLLPVYIAYQSNFTDKSDSKPDMRCTYTNGALRRCI